MSSSRNNCFGFSLVELMVVIAVTSIVCLFAFTSVRQVIMSSMGASKKTDFETLNNDIRYLVSRLDQCTCNFTGMTLQTNNPTLDQPLRSQPAEIIQYALPHGPPCDSANDHVLAQMGTNDSTGSMSVQTLDLTNVQYLPPPMNVARAELRLQALVHEQAGMNARLITRYYPIMFSVSPAKSNKVSVVGCIGMTD